MEGMLTPFQRGVLTGLEAANWDVGIDLHEVKPPLDLLDHDHTFVDPGLRRRWQEGYEYGIGLHGVVVMHSLDAKFAAEEQPPGGKFNDPSCT